MCSLSPYFTVDLWSYLLLGLLESYMCLFYLKAADIKQKIERITEDVESVKKAHSAILSAAVPDQGTCMPGCQQIITMFSMYTYI